MTDHPVWDSLKRLVPEAMAAIRQFMYLAGIPPAGAFLQGKHVWFIR